jgi:hypothetical protein
VGERVSSQAAKCGRVWPDMELLVPVLVRVLWFLEFSWVSRVLFLFLFLFLWFSFDSCSVNVFRECFS